MSNCNPDFFKKIDARSAYILGLLASDGCIRKNNIKFTNTEKSLIDICYSSMAITTQILIENRKRKEHHKTIYHVSFDCKSMVQDLAEFGIVPQKSLILKWINIPKQYESHLIRGYLDGDGTIGYYPKRKTWKVQFLGTLDFLTGIKHAINNHLNIDYGLIYPNGNIYILLYQQLEITKLVLNWLYQDSQNLRLERKYEKACQILNRNILTERILTNCKNRTLLFTLDGETKSLRQWSQDSRCQVCYETLKDRVNRGMKFPDLLYKTK